MEISAIHYKLYLHQGEIISTTREAQKMPDLFIEFTTLLETAVYTSIHLHIPHRVFLNHMPDFIEL